MLGLEQESEDAFLNDLFFYCMVIPLINPKQLTYHQDRLGVESSMIFEYMLKMQKLQEFRNERSKDLGALLDSCSWDDFWQFSADLYQKLTAAD